MRNIDIEQIQADNFGKVLTGLSVILEQCVQQQASIGFVLPFSVEQATDYWSKTVFAKLKQGNLALFVAKFDDIVVGTVQLDMDMPANQQHRADVAKLLVHPLYQRKGIARALMHTLEQEALLQARTLLVLDTKTGDSAESLYRSLSYQLVGVIPNFAKNPAHDGFASTSILYKTLSW